MNDLQYAYEVTLEGWLRALGLKDSGSEGHSLRVAELVLRLGRELGFGEDELIHLRRGALLHDIGKIGIPDAILNKPGSLTEEEWQVMKQHPTHGYQLLAPIPFLRPVLDIVYCHHENWDGSGYPQGLKDENIPLTARIVSVVNVWDALIADQPYRRAWPREEARTFIEKASSRQFDPHIVETFMQVLKDY